MATLTIHRGTHQIGGCCTELSVGKKRILIDFGANLPGSDETAPIKDSELIARVLNGRPVEALLFTHYHKDHCGLYKEAAAKQPNLPMFIGPLARQILMLVAAYTDRGAAQEGFPIVRDMRPYQMKQCLRPLPSVTIWPYYVDHSALDAYMLYIEAAGKKVLFTGDFRDHGIQGEQLWKMIDAFIAPKGVDVLITEGTMLSRDRAATEEGAILTEEALGAKAARLFSQHKYNFVLVSSTNLDSIMEFYHNTPAGMPFVCDFYQARLMIAAMEGMQRRGKFSRYRTSPDHRALRVLDPEHQKWGEVRRRGLRLKPRLDLQPITDEELERDGFVLLARKNSQSGDDTSRFEELRDKFYPLDGQIIYSMWDGYLKPDRVDKDLLHFIDGHPIEPLHTSGHAYVETIERLIGTVNPKVIIPMHTEKAEEFSSIPEFARWKGRVKVLNDGERLNLDKL